MTAVSQEIVKFDEIVRQRPFGISISISDEAGGNNSGYMAGAAGGWMLGSLVSVTYGNQSSPNFPTFSVGPLCI